DGAHCCSVIDEPSLMLPLESGQRCQSSGDEKQNEGCEPGKAHARLHRCPEPDARVEGARWRGERGGLSSNIFQNQISELGLTRASCVVTGGDHARRSHLFNGGFCSLFAG